MGVLRQYNDIRSDVYELSKELADQKILVELKAVEKMHPVYDAQIYSYLKSSRLPMGFLVNFNVPLIKDGIKRFISKAS